MNHEMVATSGSAPRESQGGMEMAAGPANSAFPMPTAAISVEFGYAGASSSQQGGQSKKERVRVKEDARTWEEALLPHANSRSPFPSRAIPLLS